MSHPGDVTWPGSPPYCPVLSQRAGSQRDVIGAALPQPPGGVQALLDGMYTELSRRHSDAEQLLLLTRRRHLLALTRQFVVFQMNLTSYMNEMFELLQQSPPIPSLLSPMCLRLREVTSHSVSLNRRLRGNPCLYPMSSSPIQEATRNIPHTLLLMEVKATLLTGQFILRVLRRVARAPTEASADLCRALTAYNQVVADLSKQASPSAELQPFCMSRTFEILAEERGRLLAGELCRVWSQRGLEDLWRREMGTRMNQSMDPNLEPCNSLQKMSQVVLSHRSSSSLGVLLQEDRRQVTPVLQILAGLDRKTWKQVPSTSEAAQYSQYCARLWPAIYSYVFHTVCPGMRGWRSLPAFPSLPEEVCVSAVQILQDTLMSEDLPEPCVSLGRSLCHRLLCVRSLISWDSAVCQALSSALTDKCGASSLGNGDPVSGNHSRTSGILLTLCQHLSRLLITPSSSHQSPSLDLWNLGDRLCSPWSELYSVTCQQGVLDRCTASLHLCDMWLRSRSQTFLSSGSLSQLVLITHGDLPVIKAQCRSLVAAVENVSCLLSPQKLPIKIKRSRDVLEDLVVSLPRVLSSVCSRRSQDIFRHMMPTGRQWRGKLVTGPDLAPSEYAQAVVGGVVVPVLDGVMSLCLEDQASAVCLAVGVVMEAWMGHVLQEKIKFSLQGALQLRCDFESVRDVLRSRDSRLSPDAVQAALALPVFAQADNAIVCLLQQPSRKAYLQTGSCAVLSCCPPLCRVAVDSMSDSLQSLDSLERRAWDGDVSGRGPRHSHNSYLPLNQRQWLSLRVHKTWNGLSLPWEGREVSEG